MLCSLLASLADTMLVFTIWIDSWGALCLPLISVSALVKSSKLTHLGDGTSEGGVSELLVHVDWVSSRQVSKNDAVVLKHASMLFVDLQNHVRRAEAYLRDIDDLTLDLSDLVLSLHVVPELALGKNCIWGEYSHSVESGIWVLLSGQCSSNNEEFLNLNC